MLQLHLLIQHLLRHQQSVACAAVGHVFAFLLQGSKDAAWRDIPELKKMRKKSFRKHLKKLATDEERQQAKAERAEQTAKKQQLIADFVAHQKKTKKAGNKEKAIKKIQEGTQHTLANAVGYSC